MYLKISGSQNVIAFSAYHDEGYVDYDAETKVDFPNVITNLGGAYDPSTSEFVSPYYHCFLSTHGTLSVHRT